MQTGKVFSSFGLGIMVLLVGCGAVKEKAAEVSNSINLPGHWLMTESINASKFENWAENESVVLTFKDGQATFSPTKSGKAVYSVLSSCTAGPRPYRLENDQIVLGAILNCPERRVTVTRLDGNRLKFGDPENAQIIRTFTRLDDERYNALVLPEDRPENRH